MLGNMPVVAMLPAIELERARRFYTEKLGLRVIRELPMARALVLEAGDGAMLGLYERAATKADHTAATWIVPNVRDVVRALKRNGVVFESYDYPDFKTDEDNIANLGDESAAWFKDTEGNILAVSQMG